MAGKNHEKFASLPDRGDADLALTIGNFDGCHLGHQALAAKTRSLAVQLQGHTAVLTFDPHPAAYFSGSAASGSMLFTPEQKHRALRELGMEHLVVQTFDARFAKLSAADFYRTYLRGHLGATAIIVGDDFRFGQDRQGDVSDLARWGAADQVTIATLAPMLYEGTKIGSRRIRATLAEGKVDAATAMLGRPYLLEGVIQRGDQLGRRLGIKTANLGQVDQLVPKTGVYAGWVWLEDKHHGVDLPPVMHRPASALPAVFNVGLRPTLAQPKAMLQIEAHIIDREFGDDGLYGLRAGYFLEFRLRDEKRFSGLEDLSQQIQRDINHARTLLTRAAAP